MSFLTKPKRSPYPHAPNSEVGTPLRWFLGLFFSNPNPHLHKSEGPGRVWSLEALRRVVSRAHNTGRVACIGVGVTQESIGMLNICV